jgi:hypothetical protein
MAEIDPIADMLRVTPEHIADILRLAERLGWPAGVTCNCAIPPVVSRGSEAWWRGWIESADGLRDNPAPTLVASGMALTLEWAADVIDDGDDPGPPATWEDQANDWIMGCTFRVPYRH